MVLTSHPRCTGGSTGHRNSRQEMYYRFGSFLAPLSIGLITSRHYLSEQNVEGTKNGRTNGDEEREGRSGQEIS